MSFIVPQSSSSARYAFDGLRTQIRDLHIENIATAFLRMRVCRERDRIATALDRMVAAMN
ncbi:hypothetical protein NKJ90_21750 [Mesorhizobium sp. M0051]|uniref:hypothetical protein n=1 Tax=unclassified Mesorhizobium TaxID=325217 RepID=UPI0003CEBDC2|nr:hypothetical protein [Mesorhizobium sp. LNHC252B00]ESY74461.1 hypothetical protein X743_08320 [Mesorhizobium sp. LNHC252B00]